jgi:hypothetical protein
MSASKCGSQPPTPPQSQCPPATPQPSDCACDQHAALIDLDVGTDNGLQIDADVLGIDVADVSIGLDLLTDLL